MNFIYLINKVELFYKIANQNLSQIDKLNTFKDKIEFCEKHFEHLSSGSSRIVFKINNDEVIKLAKNEKGIAQNKEESNPKINSKYINKTIEKSTKFNWITTHFLKKINKSRFEELTNIPFDHFCDFMFDKKSSIKPNEFAKEMKELSEKFNILPGDICRISSWGEKNNSPILIDSGLTNNVYNKFYKDNSSSSSNSSSKSS